MESTDTRSSFSGDGEMKDKGHTMTKYSRLIVLPEGGEDNIGAGSIERRGF